LSRDVHSTGCGRVVRADIGTGQSRIVVNASEFAINRDGEQLAYVLCDRPARTVALDLESGEIKAQDASSLFGDHRDYVIEGELIRRVGAESGAPQTIARTGPGWKLTQVVATRAGVFVFGRHGHEAPALYRISQKKLVRVRTYDYGHLTGVLAPR
jgi:hypothetical protein